MRRKFTDTLKSLPKDVRSCSSARMGLDFCNRLFALEANYAEKQLDFEERYRVRREQSVPVAEKFFCWAKEESARNPVPKSMLGAALGYSINQERWLMNVFLDGRLELSNNRAERAVRPFAIGRKNWLFSNTPNGADASCSVFLCPHKTACCLAFSINHSPICEKPLKAHSRATQETIGKSALFRGPPDPLSETLP